MTTGKPNLADAPNDPFGLFEAWYDDAVHCEQIKYAAAACLSTVNLDGMPDGRTLLLKFYDTSGFVFFTDEESVKGRSLGGFPQAALTFYWGVLDRQIRIRGGVEQTSDEVSDECFNHRPRGSKITAWASKQSRVLPRASELEQQFASQTDRFANEESVPRPPNWRAYRLIPLAIEFWEAKSNRLHDRLLYTKSSGSLWTTSRLYP